MVRKSEGVVYLNKVGTFGVSSTPYWWTRISGALIRLVHALLGPQNPIEILLYADDLEAMGPGKEGRRAVVLAYIYMAAVGTPFKWKKQRGGLIAEWVGLTTDYGKYMLGLSEKRSAWMVAWIESVLRRKRMPIREFLAGLGRLGFSATALEWEKPFLGPL